jgi:tetratricopeptide (TPR) repeat protein
MTLTRPAGSAVVRCCDHGAEIIAVLRWSVERDLFALAWCVASSAWPQIPTLADRAWWAELDHWGSEAAIQWRHPQALADLVDRSAQSYYRVGDLLNAEAQWIRVLWIWWQWGDTRRAAMVLERLGWMYVEWGRFHRALDAFFEALSSWQKLESEQNTTRALYAIGATMVVANRPSDASAYFQRAQGGRRRSSSRRARTV